MIGCPYLSLAERWGPRIVSWFHRWLCNIGLRFFCAGGFTGAYWGTKYIYRLYPTNEISFTFLFLDVFDHLGYSFGLKLGLELVHLNRLHVNLNPECKHLKIPQTKHSIHIMITYVQNSDVPKIKRIILRMFSLYDLCKGDMVAGGISPYPVELLCDILFHPRCHLMLIFGISHDSVFPLLII